MSWTLTRQDIHVTKVNDGLTTLQFDTMEVATPQKETRAVVEHVHHLPVPRQQVRSKMRKASVTINIDDALRTKLGEATIDATTEKVILFLLCACVLAALIAALAATLEVAPITWPQLIELFVTICATCVALVNGADNVKQLSGKTDNVENWGKWENVPGT